MKVKDKLKVNIDRLKENIIELSNIGKSDNGGLYRMAFNKDDYHSRLWLLKKVKDLGLDSRLDGALNVIGRLDSKNDENKAVIVGSHIDTVPNAGALDGALGVLVGLECIQRIREEKIPLKYPLELIAFSDEEGRFGGMFGSRSFAGMMTPGYLEEASDLDGIKLKDALRELGHDPYKALDAARNSDEIKYFMELHIEQGPVLDQKHHQIGIVTDITGLYKWQVTLTGDSNHAGTTPMEMRNDAFMGLADFAHEIPRLIDENGSDVSRMTIGKVQLFPGSPNTVPGQVKFSLDVRDVSADVMYELQDASRKALSAIARRRKLMFEFEELSWIDPVKCDKELISVLEKVSKEQKINYITMPSGAAHDAQMVASIAPIGMLFVPSKGGVSHTPHEWTDWRDIETGANVMLEAILNINS